MFLVFAGMFLGGCSTPRNVTTAAHVAVKFCKIAFVQQNLDEGYLLLAPDTRHDFPLGLFKLAMEKIHSNGFPTAVTAAEYETGSSKDSVDIFLVGHKGNQAFYYRVVLKANAKGSFDVASVFRANNPPPGWRKSIKPTISTEAD